MRKGCLYWLFIGWWWEPFIWIFKLIFSKGFWKFILYMTLFGILLYVSVAVIPFAIICFAIYFLYIIIKKILDGSLKKKYSEIIFYFKKILRKFRKTENSFSKEIAHKEDEKIKPLSESELAYIRENFSDNIDQIEKENNEEEQKKTEYRKLVNPVYTHRKEHFDWERYAVMCNAYVTKEERKEKEIKQLNHDLDELNSNLENIEKQIDEMMESAIKAPNSFDNMDGHQFEYFCADILRKNGFSNVTVTQGSGDHGIDILADKYGISYAIQCKCYSSDIGNAAVQQAHTGKSLYHKDIAVVLTNRYFTPQAKEEATALGVKLWDRDKLNEMIENQSEDML